jgi:hypothetical protein
MSSGRSLRSLGKLSPADVASRKPASQQTRSEPTLTTLCRTITALAVVVSAAGYGGIISLGQYIFASQFVFTAKMFPQLWRIFTAFLITKPKFAILLDPYFLYQYGSAIERESSRFSQPGDFFTYTMFVGSLIVVSLPCRSRDCTYTNTSTHRHFCLRQQPRPTTSYICPHSDPVAVAVLKQRESTPAHDAVPSSINQSKGLWGV